MAVYYEWDVEVRATVDSEEFAIGDVIDHLHQTSYKDAATVAATTPADGAEHRIVLVRDDDTGRAWAELDDGKLPVYFEDAYNRNVAKVPARFIAEVARIASRNA